jgi:2-oxoisovalerate dehydrogenase E1 component
MLMIRELEEMIVTVRSGAYEPLTGFNYRGPTHVSIGQEGASVGACSALILKDHITSTHRGHGDSVARGCCAIREYDDELLRKRVPNSQAAVGRDELLEQALGRAYLSHHRELFGKEDGYCRGRGGSMHIADFTVGHLGANAIVGGGVPIATGAAMGSRYLQDGGVVCCFAGDGAYCNGVVLESLNWAAQAQFTNEIAGDRRFGVPIIFFVLNNHYAMTGRSDNEVMGVSHVAQRAAGFADNRMHAEIINGMDVLATRDAVLRAAQGCREGQGPYFFDVDTYRYFGHSLSDPRNEYRTREKRPRGKPLIPLSLLKSSSECGVLDQQGIAAVEKRVKRAQRARGGSRGASGGPSPRGCHQVHVHRHHFGEGPAEFAKVEVLEPLPPIKRANGEITYRDAIKEAVMEEMLRDSRVIFYGEDVAEYGGAFKLSKGLLEMFGRARVFNAPISEACICGTAVGAAMIGLRPVVELMYMDFLLMAGDQVGNQAAKWHYMSGAHAEVPMVLRVSVGAGKGYGGQHSQTLESTVVHVPGLYVVYPSTLTMPRA